MLKYIGYIAIFVLLTMEAKAQKILEKSWNAELFNGIEIVSDEVFKIKIISEETQTIALNARIEGEFSENIIIEVNENAHDQGILSFSTGFTPYFEMENDKLAAHKVHSIEMELQIPNGMKVYVRSALASVEASGLFQELRLELEKGNCLLKPFEGDALLSSKNGSITVYGKNLNVWRAVTTHGTLTNKLLNKGKYSLEAQSVNGDITLLPSQ